WRADTGKFDLPPETLPAPMFPIEGILTRFVQFVPNAASPPPFPLRMFETSSPGLRGQSGGPVFDQKGRIWGIQSRTVHYPLGFSPPVPNSTKGEKEHQFLNVGRCVHAESIIEFCKLHNVEVEVSEH